MRYHIIKTNQFIFLLDICFLERILFLVLIRLCNNLNENNIHSNQISPKQMKAFSLKR